MTERLAGAVSPSSDAAAAAAYCSDEDDDGDSTLAGFTGDAPTDPFILRKTYFHRVH